MVVVRFKLADIGPIHLDIGQPEKLKKILQLCSDKHGESIGSVIVIRSGKVCGKLELIEPNDTLEVYPAISGG